MALRDSWQEILQSTCPDEFPDDQCEDPLQQDDDFDAIDAHNDAVVRGKSEDELEKDGEETLSETSPLDCELRADASACNASRVRHLKPGHPIRIFDKRQNPRRSLPFNITLGLWYEG